MTDLAREVYDRWLADFPPEERGEGYLKADFTQEKFLTYYTAWYLNHIAQLVERLDPAARATISIRTRFWARCPITTFRPTRNSSPRSVRRCT